MGPPVPRQLICKIKSLKLHLKYGLPFSRGKNPSGGGAVHIQHLHTDGEASPHSHDE
uniref:Uncharacterized protein n=1 Tax=Anguilla anguilla TaxID=7936 RepID=A0A0E9TF51_ANGAN